MKEIFIDTDVILDVIMKRAPFYVDASRIFSLAKEQTINLHASSTCFTDLFYVFRRIEGAANSIAAIKLISNYVNILSVDSKIVHLALDSPFTDFEDAVQYYTALHHNMECILTRNVRDFKVKDIIVITPSEFLSSRL